MPIWSMTWIRQMRAGDSDVSHQSETYWMEGIDDHVGHEYVRGLVYIPVIWLATAGRKFGDEIDDWNVARNEGQNANPCHLPHRAIPGFPKSCRLQIICPPIQSHRP